jgi:hypothetical protein
MGLKRPVRKDLGSGRSSIFSSFISTTPIVFRGDPKTAAVGNRTDPSMLLMPPPLKSFLSTRFHS